MSLNITKTVAGDSRFRLSPSNELSSIISYPSTNPTKILDGGILTFCLHKAINHTFSCSGAIDYTGLEVDPTATYTFYLNGVIVPNTIQGGTTFTNIGTYPANPTTDPLYAAFVSTGLVALGLTTAITTKPAILIYKGPSYGGTGDIHLTMVGGSSAQTQTTQDQIFAALGKTPPAPINPTYNYNAGTLTTDWCVNNTPTGQLTDAVWGDLNGFVVARDQVTGNTGRVFNVTPTGITKVSSNSPAIGNFRHVSPYSNLNSDVNTIKSINPSWTYTINQGSYFLGMCVDQIQHTIFNRGSLGFPPEAGLLLYAGGAVNNNLKLIDISSDGKSIVFAFGTGIAYTYFAGGAMTSGANFVPATTPIIDNLVYGTACSVTWHEGSKSFFGSYAGNPPQLNQTSFGLQKYNVDGIGGFIRAGTYNLPNPNNGEQFNPNGSGITIFQDGKYVVLIYDLATTRWIQTFDTTTNTFNTPIDITSYTSAPTNDGHTLEYINGCVMYHSGGPSSGTMFFRFDPTTNSIVPNTSFTLSCWVATIVFSGNTPLVVATGTLSAMDNNMYLYSFNGTLIQQILS